MLLPIFNFTYTQNNGISLGLFNAQTDVGRWMLVAVTSAIAVGVAVWIGREKNRVDQAALGMVLGGALGNILDRTLHGYVVDFLDLHFGEFRPFLIFNVGDAAISIAVAILLLRAFLTRKDRPKGGPRRLSNMRKVLLALVMVAAVSTSGCAALKGHSRGPDEFAVARSAPLIIPPDFNLAPPVAGTLRPFAGEAQQQAVDALFGGPALRSAGETSLLDVAGRETRRSASARPHGIPTRASSTRGRRR